MTGDQCRRLAAEVAEHHGGVVSRALLRQMGVLRHHVRKEVDRERWRLHGQQTVAVHRRELSRDERWWRAIWETGAGAALDGVTALIAAGLKGYEEELVHVSARRSFRAKDMSGIDFARLCRARGLPEPVRQEIVKDDKGRIYLDVRWDCGLVVEIDGAGHRWGLQVSRDNLRQNGLVIAGNRVLRIDALGLRLFTDKFMAQVMQGLIVFGGYSADR